MVRDISSFLTLHLKPVTLNYPVSKANTQRIYASLLILGASILLSQTVLLVIQGAYDTLMPWVFFLLILEMFIDFTVIITALPWLIKTDPEYSSTPLRFGAAAAILHAFRVMIFALGRVEPFLNFDVRPEQRALHHTRWTWNEVYFASALSIAGIIGVIIIWQIRRRREK